MVKVRKVGNSITVSIPRDVVAEMGITEDMDMNMFVREGAVVMEPAVSKWDRLVARVRRGAPPIGDWLKPTWTLLWLTSGARGMARSPLPRPASRCPIRASS